MALDRKPGPKAPVPRARRLADLILSGVPAEVKVRDDKVFVTLGGDDLRKAGLVPEDLVTIDGQHALEALLELVRRGDAVVPLAGSEDYGSDENKAN